MEGPGGGGGVSVVMESSFNGDTVSGAGLLPPDGCGVNVSGGGLDLLELFDSDPADASGVRVRGGVAVTGTV